MSTEYSVHVGYGFIIPKEFINDNFLRIAEKSSFELIINYINEIPNIFFGIILKTLDEGTAFPIEVFPTYSHEELWKMLQEYKELCPGLNNYIPRIYVLYCMF